jgi:hypothetical protein
VAQSLMAARLLRYVSRPRTHELTHIEHLATLRDIREQHIPEGVLSVERRTSLIFARDDSPNSREVALTERIVLRAARLE